MSDIAQLGFDIDTKTLTAANDQLDRMEKTSETAKRGTDKLNESFEKTNTATAKVQKAIEHFGESIRENLVDAVKQAVGAFIAFFAIERLVEKFKATAEAIDQTSKAARAMGSSFAALQAVQLAGTLAGQSADAMDVAGKRMSKALGLAIAAGQGAKGVFKDLGVTAQQLAAMPVDQRFATIADKIKSMGLNTAATTALLAKLGDRTGSLVSLMQEGGDTFRKASEEVTKFHLALSDTTGKAVEEMMDNFIRLGYAIQGAFNQIIGAVAPVLGPLVGMLADGIAALVGAFGQWMPYLQQAAILMAITFGPGILLNIGKMIVGIGEGLVKAMLGFDAAADANPIGLIIAAVGLLIYAIYQFRDDIKAVFGIDVVAFAGQAANFLIRVFMTALAQAKLAWSGLAPAIASGVIEATNVVIRGINSMIQGAIGGINSLLGALKNIPGLGDKVNLIDASAGNIPEMKDTFAGKAKAALDEYQTSMKTILSTDYVGQLTAGLKNLGKTAEGLLPAGETGANGLNDLANTSNAAADAAAKLSKAYDGIVLSAQDKIAQNLNEIASIGKTAEQTEYLKEKQDLLNQALKAGITLTAAQSAQLDALARQEAQTASAASELKGVYDQAKSTFTGFFTGLANDLEQGKGLWQSLADVAIKALDDILNKAIEVIANSAFDSLWNGGGSSGGGGIGGWIMSLFTGGATANAKGGVYQSSNLSGYSNSIVSTPTMFKFASGAGLMGEAGPEAIMPLKRGRDGSLGVAMASNDNAANNNGTILLQPIIYNNASDAVQVSTSQDQNGQLVVMIDRVVADNMKNSGSATHKAAKQTFGLKKATVAR